MQSFSLGRFHSRLIQGFFKDSRVVDTLLRCDDIEFLHTNFSVNESNQPSVKSLCVERQC